MPDPPKPTPDTAKRRFHRDYREEVTLKDGSSAVFRLVRPADKAALLEGLKRMSPESRYLRFFSARDSLSASELSYLTEVDQEHHFALAVGVEGDSPVGYGVGRFVRDRDDPTRAEVAVAVVDDAQGKGLGRMLFERLVVAARERGVTEFHLEILAENDAMLGLLRSLFPEVVTRPDSDVVEVSCPLPAPRAPTDGRPDGPFYRVMALAAEGALRVIRAARSWPVPPDLGDGILGRTPPAARIVDDKRE